MQSLEIIFIELAGASGSDHTMSDKSLRQLTRISASI